VRREAPGFHPGRSVRLGLASASVGAVNASGLPDPEIYLSPLLAIYRDRHPKASTSRVKAAYQLAAEAHHGQLRKSGEPYVSHPVAVATILAELGLDDITLAAALLHDSVEDTGVTYEDLDAKFGREVAQIVDGVTKLERLQFDSKEAQQAATMRKMLVAMAKDLRVLLIKLADRTHNMRTIDAVSEDWKRRRTAQETLDIYAPLAHRLGIGEIKHELEDLSFRALEPRKYAEIQSMVQARAGERDKQLAKTIADVTERLAELSIEAKVVGREKHLWSIYEKMVVKGKDFSEIHDLMGIRVIVESVKDCYAALGCIHAAYKPVQGRFKDYIAMPKFNLYQSLHTTVIGPEGRVIECQVRTSEMHNRAEQGIAAHWAYKAGKSGPTVDPIDPANIAWLQRVTESATNDNSDPDEFLETLKTDLDQEEVFVFSPKGKVVTLPAGATPIDFAYAIHTDIGHRCIGARVNSRLVPLETRLGSGETVEIIVSKVETAQPSRDWLNIVTTPRARAKIKQWFSKERREDALESGRDEVVRALRKDALPAQKIMTGPILEAVAAELGYADLNSMFVAVGEGHVSPTGLAQRVARSLRGGEFEEQLPAEPTRSRPSRERRRAKAREGVGVHVEGLDDVMVRLSRCCTPVPGDDIVGFVTRGRGVSVHRADCANSNSLRSGAQGRMIEVEWDSADAASHKRGFVVSIMVEALDRARLLADVARVLSDNHVNVLGCSTHTGSDRVARQKFDFEMGDPSHLEAVLREVRKVESVFDSYRILPGQRRD
jgi:GTP diphosphokinase / guanosine-3',5'-bis(diphosphate) 3'-diphosphatase